jgi:Tol biopolymer transport system component
LARRVAIGLLALLLVAAAGYLLGLPDLLRARRTVPPPQRPMRLVPITALTGWQDWPSLSPDGMHVAFEWAGDRNDNHDIYVTIVGSRDVRRLTTHPAEDFAPSWSPNGREIAFLRTENGVTRIHVMSALGGPDRTLSDFPAWASINWSPDAVAERDPDRGIYLVPVSGGTPRAIETLRAPAEAHSPAFSPDGRRLAYARCESIDTEGNSVWAERSSQGCQVRLVEVDERYVPRSAPRRLPVGPMSTVGALTWDRDGKSIVFCGEGDQRSIPAEGGAARQLTKQAGEQSAPTWSHDGQWIYFSHNGSGRHEVWRVRSAGGTPEQISRNGSGVVALESPDGQHVIYKLGDQDAQIVEASLNGDGSRILVPCVSRFWGFSVVGETLYYIPCAPARAGTIRVLDLATRRDLLWAVVPDVSLVPNAESAYLWDLAISPDGTSLLYDRPVNFHANLWMLENFR